MSSTYNLGYKLLNNSNPPIDPRSVYDRSFPVAAMHRMAVKAIEKLLLLMNNTKMLTRHHRLTSMSEVVIYLLGHHEDEGMPGDRGDFNRRMLSEQIHHHFHIYNLDHTNILQFIDGLICLEKDCRLILSRLGGEKLNVPPVKVDDQILDIVGRLADVH